jgi:hypothetical protein
VGDIRVCPKTFFLDARLRGHDGLGPRFFVIPAKAGIQSLVLKEVFGRFLRERQ